MYISSVPKKSISDFYGTPENNVNVPLNDGLSSALVLDVDTGEQTHFVLIRNNMKQYEIMIGWKKLRGKMKYC